jgi:hypothetical protein
MGFQFSNNSKKNFLTFRCQKGVNKDKSKIQKKKIQKKNIQLYFIAKCQPENRLLTGSRDKQDWQVLRAH